MENTGNQEDRVVAEGTGEDDGTADSRGDAREMSLFGASNDQQPRKYTTN